MPRQADLAQAARLHQSRISMFETPGAANVTLETLSRLAAAFNVGLVVKFVPFSEMLRWENSYSQDTFEVTPIQDDVEFLNPELSLQRQQPFTNGLTLGTPIAADPAFDRTQYVQVKSGKVDSDAAQTRGFMPPSTDHNSLGVQNIA